jgi:hypothetical protein
VKIYEMREIYPAFEWNFPFLACTHLIILNLHEHDNEFKSHAALHSLLLLWLTMVFLRAHGLASSKVHRTKERNKIVLLNLVCERKIPDSIRSLSIFTRNIERLNKVTSSSKITTFCSLLKTYQFIVLNIFK